MIGIRKGKAGKRYLYAAAIVAGLLVMTALLFPGCKGEEEESVKITTEPVGGSGVLVLIEHYRDSELVNSMRLIDGDGDGIVDGKSGPTESGLWPKGWEWFDDLFDNVIVGSSKLAVTADKVKVQNSATHEFRTGEYQAQRVETKAE